MIKMPADDEQIAYILSANPIKGVDFSDGLARFASHASIYLRILDTFIKSTPEILGDLAKVTPQTISEYTVRIHGLKGSCYGISAIKLGDEAKALEQAAKDSDWDTIQRDNPLIIEHTCALIDQLQRVVDLVEHANEVPADPRPLLDKPDEAQIEKLLEATLDFDYEAIERAIKELDLACYRSDPNLVQTLKEQLTLFRYDLIENKALELLR